MTEQYRRGEVPAGVTLGTKMLLVPAVFGGTFSHSGALTGLRDRTNYAWIKRGDPIARYRLTVPRLYLPFLGGMAGEIEHEALVRCPSSGLLIHGRYDYSNDDECEFSRSDGHAPVRMAILLPDDEPPAEDGRFMFTDLARCVWDNREPFLRPSRYWSMGAMTEAHLRQQLDAQLALKPRLVDAMPQYEDYFEKARTEFPQLRPHLKHLFRAQ